MTTVTTMTRGLSLPVFVSVVLSHRWGEAEDHSTMLNSRRSRSPPQYWTR